MTTSGDGRGGDSFGMQFCRATLGAPAEGPPGVCFFSLFLRVFSTLKCIAPC